MLDPQQILNQATSATKEGEIPLRHFSVTQPHNLDALEKVIQNKANHYPFPVIHPQRIPKAVLLWHG
jgi:hypothetical protein